MKSKIIEFIRKKDFKLLRDVGQGGFGKTVLLRDELIDAEFVCKKYSPYYSELKEEFFNNFIQEIKLLHLLYHPNIVRIFNYYLYPEYHTGYILMEYIEGKNVEEYINQHPETVNDLFKQIISGFQYLEKQNILHRDIRPANILVDNFGNAKIIDFGFGKKIKYSKDFDKSINLNWWCEPPNDFSSERYDHVTEIYFVGKLFEKFIIDNSISTFAYKETLGKMINKDPESRIISFNDIARTILNLESDSLEFDDDDVKIYRDFADYLSKVYTKFESGAEYINDLKKVLSLLEKTYKNNILEEFIHNNVQLTRCFAEGTYYYSQALIMPVQCLGSFLELLKKNPIEKQRVVLNNLQNRLDSIQRYSEPPEPPNDWVEDDIPF